MAGGSYCHLCVPRIPLHTHLLPSRGTKYALWGFNPHSVILVCFAHHPQPGTPCSQSHTARLACTAHLHLQPVHHPFATKGSLRPRRYQAYLIGTTYVYDFPDLFGKALHNLWAKARAANSSLVQPKVFLVSKELVLDENDELQEVDRSSGNNTCGMVAWVFTLYTSEAPRGRRVVAIVNDITYKIGSFGPQED
ncbi:hypothetical protein M422DRAFT_275215 [Sphaerobolus stellatus SS14]|uniref:CoA carboxyltransferase N-terminal domain-containing protein n=1 Tax=Sphaerobolus stellatus (strain SS14) TaxID=990650 RepID=A0A0C9T5E3_SPHS4|nr:hypothetical protein M422DRAFT_275215 [Sphaerobolus stellatus SS14]